jgi:hypothetical protein
MATILAANRSSILINGNPVQGLQEITYQRVQPRADIVAVGSDERIGYVFGAVQVTGTIRVRSVAKELDELLAGRTPCQIMASLRPAGSEEATSISLDEVLLEGKSFALAAGGVAEVVYTFSATRVR